MNALFQSLEARKLLASVSATLVDGKLTVTGTEGADNIYVDFADTGDGSYSSVGIYKNDDDANPQLIKAYPISAVKSLSIDARGGNDRVEFGYYVLSEETVPVTVLGGQGNDQIVDSRVGNGYGTLIDGGVGDDTLLGGDTMLGGDGRDTIYSLAYDGLGNGPPNSTEAHINGGIGNDTINGTRNDTIVGGDGNDLIYNGAVVDAGAGFDTVYTRWNAVVHLGPDNDKHYINYNSRDYGYNGDPNDFFGPTSITSYGDGGNDIITVTQDLESTTLMGQNILKVFGGADNDTIYGGAARDTLNGEAGNDKIFGGDNNDTLNGGTGNDLLYGDNGNDDVFGSDGNDTLYGGAGNNRLFGQKGIDVIHAKNNLIDQIIGSQDGDNVLDRDPNDVLKAS